MHPADITAALKKVGSSQTQIARDLGISQAAVWFVIAGRKKSARVARRVSAQTGIAVETLWPGMYAATSGKREVKTTTRPQRAQPPKVRRAA